MNTRQFDRDKLRRADGVQLSDLRANAKRNRDLQVLKSSDGAGSLGYRSIKDSQLTITPHTETCRQGNVCSNARRTSPARAGNWNGRSPIRANVRFDIAEESLGEPRSLIL